jgi:hypothetical protein
MPTALVLCIADPAGNPRPNRMIRCLARDFQVHVVSSVSAGQTGVEYDQLAPPPRSARHRLAKILRLVARRYDGLLWTPQLRKLAAKHRALDHAFITVHELRLLPFALAIRRSGRVLFDAREYYPRHFEDVWWWRLLYQPFNRELCREYLPHADHVVTVCRGLAEEYERELGIHCELLPSYPMPVACEPQPVDPARIRLVHHGLASRSRQIELMIEMVDHLPERFVLDLILMPSDDRYLETLRRMCAPRPRVRILPPLSFAELVPATNAYDVGVFLVPPVNFNLRFALPNKFFEFVQARLLVAVGPSPEMARLVREHDLGVVAADFRPATLAATLAGLSLADIERFKHNAHRAAAVLNSDQTDALVRRIALDPQPRIPASTPS